MSDRQVFRSVTISSLAQKMHSLWKDEDCFQYKGPTCCPKYVIGQSVIFITVEPDSITWLRFHWHWWHVIGGESGYSITWHILLKVGSSLSFVLVSCFAKLRKHCRNTVSNEVVSRFVAAGGGPRGRPPPPSRLRWCWHFPAREKKSWKERVSEKRKKRKEPSTRAARPVCEEKTR